MNEKWTSTAYIGGLALGIGLFVGNYVAWFTWSKGIPNPTAIGAVAMCLVGGAVLGALAVVTRDA